jgi:hypothetical protein
MKRFLLLAALGCADMKPADDTCFDYVGVVPRDPGRVQYTVPVVDFDTQLSAPVALPDAALQVCINATCLPEFPRCTTDVGNCYREFPGANPALRVLDFPFGLTNVTLRFSLAGYVPTDYPLGGPLVGDPAGGLEVRGVGIVLVKEPTFAALQAQVGGVPDPTRGTLAVRVLDCALGRSAGETLEPYNANLGGATAFSLSSNNVASGSDLTTDQRGVAGFFNLPAQTIDMQVAGWPFEPTTFNVRPGTLTLGELRWGLEEFGQ